MLLTALLQCKIKLSSLVWLVGSYVFNSPLRQYHSQKWAFSQREGERREMIDKRKMSKQPPSTPTASAIGPCLTINQINRTIWHPVQRMVTVITSGAPIFSSAVFDENIEVLS